MYKVKYTIDTNLKCIEFTLPDGLYEDIIDMFQSEAPDSMGYSAPLSFFRRGLLKWLRKNKGRSLLLSDTKQILNLITSAEKEGADSVNLYNELWMEDEARRVFVQEHERGHTLVRRIRKEHSWDSKSPSPLVAKLKAAVAKMSPRENVEDVVGGLLEPVDLAFERLDREIQEKGKFDDLSLYPENAHERAQEMTSDLRAYEKTRKLPRVLRDRVEEYAYGNGRAIHIMRDKMRMTFDLIIERVTDSVYILGAIKEILHRQLLA